MEQVDKDINVRSKDKPRAEGVWNAGYKTGYDKGYKDAQKVKDSQDLVKDLVKAFCEDGTWLERQGVYTLTLAEAKQRAVDIIESVLAKDEPITKTETQNSNLTFEKRTMRDCYNCRKYETEGECVECKFEPKDEPQTDEEYINSLPWTEVGNGEQTDDAYFLKLMGAVDRGEISDAGANQAWYEYINHKDECAKEYEELGLKELKELIEADRKDEPQTEK